MKSIVKKSFSMVLFGSIFSLAGGLFAAQSATLIQQWIDAAPPGSEILVPQGLYQGTLVLRDQIILRGEGAGHTILDGDGAPLVVEFGKESALIGFTVRNGEVLADNRGNFFGLLECELEAYSRMGVHIDRGSGVVMDNRIHGADSTRGIVAHEANALITQNTIKGNRIGVLWFGQLAPSILDNLFLNNETAIAGTSDAEADIQQNRFAGNQTNLRDLPLPESNQHLSATTDAAIAANALPTDRLLDLMASVYEGAARDHSMVIYDLPQETGSFSTLVLFPWATFSVGVSAFDTRISSYNAEDLLTGHPMRAEYLEINNEQPAVRVDNPELLEKMRERYLLAKRYEHPASYHDLDDGTRIFRRQTSVSNIEVLLPHGYRAISVSPEGRINDDGERQLVEILDIGLTDVEVMMHRLPDH